MKTVLGVVIVLILVGCTDPATICSDSGGHKWGKWEDIPSPNWNTLSHSKKTCIHCGWAIRKAY